MTFIDLRTNNKFEFKPKDVFLVTIRRSNGKPKPIYTGLVASRAFEIYHNLKIFIHDRKYLAIKRSNEAQEILIYKESGKDPKVRSFIGYKIKPNFTSKVIQNVTNIPVSLYDTFKVAAKTHKNELGAIMTVNKLIPILMAHFGDLTHEEQLNLISSAMKVMARHKILSGGDNTHEIKSLLSNDPDLADDPEKLPEDDLL